MTIEVRAQITGTVWQVKAQVGDTVAEEQVLIILESMKMEMPVESPEAGRLVELAVAEGQSVEEGDLLARIEVP